MPGTAGAVINDVLALILGGGRGPGLYPLTRHRSTPAVPLAGKYRLIDIPISNCLNSGVNRAYVLTQYLSVSLHRHITDTYKFDPFGNAFVGVLAAHQTNETTDWYRGTADAVRQQVRYVKEEGAGRVLILSGDQLYRMDFRRVLRTHEETGAEVTLAVLPVTAAEAGRLGLVLPDQAGRVAAFSEYPHTGETLEAMRLPAGWLEQRGVVSRGREFLGSMGIYLFERDTLIELLAEPAPADDFGREIFPRSVGRRRFQTHLFDGYWADLGSVRSYYEANLSLAGDGPQFDFHSPEGVVYTRMRNLPASLVMASAVEQCLISDGCTIGEESRLERCVLGVRTRIGRRAVLRDAVILGANWFETEADRFRAERGGVPGVGIGDGTVLERAIVDKNCRIGKNVRLVNRAGVRQAEGENYVIRDGIIVIPNRAVVPDGTEI